MEERLNILWISFEDCLPLYGCYGDKIARTPGVDRLASEGRICPTLTLSRRRRTLVPLLDGRHTR